VRTNIKESLAKIAPRTRLLYLLAILALVTTHCVPRSANDESRIATVQSLVESGSLIIDKTPFIATRDKVFINGHFYSDKPPVPSVLGAAVYLPLYHLGFGLHEKASVPYYLVTLLTVKLFWLLGSVAFFCALGFTGLDAERRFLASVSLAFGSLYFSWSTVFNSHELAAAFLGIGFYFLLKARFSAQVNINLGIAAFFLSLASTADIPTGVFYALFLAYVVRDARLRHGTVWYVLPLLVTLLPALALTYSIHHSILPVQIIRSYFQYPGSPWIKSGGLSGMEINTTKFSLKYGLLVFMGPKGFLIYNPILWIALWGLLRTIRQRGLFFYEAIVVGAGSVILALYYVLFTTNYGGWSYSIRWFVPVLPLLFFFLYPYFAAYDERRARYFRVLLGAAVVIALVGALNPWSDASWSAAPFIANVKQLSTGLASRVAAHCWTTGHCT
jgi:hypothetical protein